MYRKLFSAGMFLMLLFPILNLLGCGGKTSGSSSASTGNTARTTLYNFLLPNASGSLTYGNDLVSIDASNTSDGYVMVQYGGAADKVKVQITIPDQTVYSYTVSSREYETFPLSGGSGSYHLDVLEHAYDDMYALAFSQDISVDLKDEFCPFLYPNQYVWYTEAKEAVLQGIQLSENASGDLDYVEQVYKYVTGNIEYDDELAATVTAGYLPDIDRTLNSKKGICFDYASLMAAMLRSQGIPTKLVVGYAGDAYHAWLNVYLTEIGWVDKIIEFDGKSWVLMDPTFAANNSRSSMKKYIGDGNNYSPKYSY